RVLGDPYEWTMPTGGHGLRFASPRIVLTARSVSRGGTVVAALPAAIDRAVGASEGSGPTAILPSPAEIAELARKAITLEGKGLQGWEIERIHELQQVGGDRI